MILARGFENLVRGARAAGLAAALVMASAGAGDAVELAFPAFKQAVAEAAAPTRDIAAFYRNHAFAAVWTGPDAASRARRAALIEALGRADLHGLPKDRYDPERLLEMLAAARGPLARGRAEVALSKAFVNFARDLQSGVLDPASIDEGIKRHRRIRDAAVYLTVISGTDRPRSYLRRLAPRTLEYRALMKAKLRLEEIIAKGGWGPAVPAGALEPGDSGTAVVALRERLWRMGYLGPSVTMTYDDAIAEAVRRFQNDHGLSVDGKAGRATIAEINRPPEARLRSVIVAMERERWLPRERGARFVRVNITDFSTRMFDNGRIVYESRAVVGANAHDRRTPEFSDTMEHMIINPRWNVPRTIAVKEYLPQLQANPGAAGQLRLYRGGREVSRAGIDFSAYTARPFPSTSSSRRRKAMRWGWSSSCFPTNTTSICMTRRQSISSRAPAAPTATAVSACKNRSNSPICCSPIRRMIPRRSSSASCAPGRKRRSISKRPCRSI